MAKLMVKDQPVCAGPAGDASAIKCTDADGNASTVQAVLDEQNKKIGNVYSTEEVKTNDKWIDGKPLYRKTIEFNQTLSSMAESLVIPVEDVETIFLSDKSYTKTSEDASRIFPFPYVHNDSNSVMGGYFGISNGIPTFYLRKGSENIITKLVLTVEYTKITD